MFAKQQQPPRSNRRPRRYRRKNQKQLKNDDAECPEKRLDEILKGLKERLHGEKETLYKLQTHRNDLECEFNGLQDE